MIKVFSFRPEFFNNNGDQGNLEAIRHFLNVEIEFSAIDEADFVLIGDASRAAMREFDKELLALTPALQERLDKGLPTLVIGSSYEFYSELLAGTPRLSYGARASEFRTAKFAELTVRGYRNSEVVDQDLFVSGAFVMTTLFGPVLAKNPQLLQLMARNFGCEANFSPLELEWIEKL